MCSGTQVAVRCDASKKVMTYALSNFVTIIQIADSDMLAARQHWCSWATHVPLTVRLKSHQRTVWNFAKTKIL